jgi:hypothetical protein
MSSTKMGTITFTPSFFQMHRRVGADASEAQLNKYLLEAAEAFVATLLEAVEALEQAGDPGQVALSKAVGLLHVHVNVVQLAVEVSVADVNQLQLEVLKRVERKDGTESSPFCHRGEGLIEVNTGTLTKNTSHLIPMNSPALLPCRHGMNLLNCFLTMVLNCVNALNVADFFQRR